MSQHQQDPQTTLRTDRLLLRAADPFDAEALHAVFNDEETMRYWLPLPFEQLHKEQLHKGSERR